MTASILADGRTFSELRNCIVEVYLNFQIKTIVLYWLFVVVQLSDHFMIIIASFAEFTHGTELSNASHNDMIYGGAL